MLFKKVVETILLSQICLSSLYLYFLSFFFKCFPAKQKNPNTNQPIITKEFLLTEHKVPVHSAL